MRMLMLLAFVASCSPPAVDGPPVDMPTPGSHDTVDDTVDTPDTPSDDVVDDTPADTDFCEGVIGGDPCNPSVDTDTIDSDTPPDDTDTDVPADSDPPVDTGVLYCPDEAVDDPCFCQSHPSDQHCTPVDTDVPADTDTPADSDTVDTDVPADTDPPTFEELCPPPSDQYEWYPGIVPEDLHCICGYYPSHPACVCPARPPDDAWCMSEGWPW